MKIIKKISIIALLGAGVAMSTYADTAVIVNPANLDKLDQAQIRNIFLGKVKSFSDGASISAFDLPAGNAAREDFVGKLLRKSEANLNSYWARMLFSSKGRPPKEVATAAAVMKEVAGNKAAIGYVDAAVVDSSVRVVFIIK